MSRYQPPGLSIDVSQGDPVVVGLRGELDIATAAAVREALLSTLASVDGTPVALDTSGLTFVDSTGLGVLLMGARRFAADGKTLRLRPPSHALDRVIKLTGVEAAFQFEADGDATPQA